MAKLRYLLLFVLLFSTQVFAQEIWENPPVRLPDNVAEWLYREVKINPGSSAARTTRPIRLEHIDIPARLLSAGVGVGLRPEIYDSLVYEENGEKFIRWMFNPEDTKYRYDVIAFVRAATNQEPVVKKEFVGYLTASRSVVVHNPRNNAIFSLKASTNRTGGNWHDKKMTKIAALISRAYSDFIARNAPKDRLKTFVALIEPFAAIAEGIDASFTIRDYPIFTDETIRLIPFFSALQPEYGAALARKLGADDPNTFWRKHLSEPWGQAMAEGLAYYGFYPNSAHSQDFLIECDQKGQPTGRIYARDIMDSDGDRMILEARGATDVLRVYEHTEVIRAWSGKILMKAVPFSGHHAPSWLRITEFMTGFFKKFIRRYQRLTGVQHLPMPQRMTWAVLERDVSADPGFIGWVEKLRAARFGRCQDIFRGAGH